MEIKIKKYSNGSYSYWSERLKREHNIPSELAMEILKLQEKLREKTKSKEDHVRMIIVPYQK